MAANVHSDDPVPIMPLRTEFRFVLDGIELDERQKEQVTVAIQRSVLEALTAHVRLEAPLVLGHANPRLHPEWHGLWVLNGARALNLGQKLDELGFYR